MHHIFTLPSAQDMPTHLLDGQPGRIKQGEFPDGERNLFLGREVAGSDALLVGRTHTDAATLELFDAACAAVKYGARRLTLLVPYFGYSTQERAAHGSDSDLLEVVPAKCRARLLSAIPQAAQGNRIILFDLHAEGIPHYFEGNIITHHLYGKTLVVEQARELAKGRKLVFASADAGRAKWVKSLARDAGCQSAFALKERLSGSQTELTGIFGDVKDAVVVLYDDMVRTGGSVIGAAKAYRENGAAEVHLIASHGVLPDDSILTLRNSGLFDSATFTDSHPGALRAERLAPGFVKIESMIPLANQLLSHLH